MASKHVKEKGSQAGVQATYLHSLQQPRKHFSASTKPTRVCLILSCSRSL